MVLKDIFKKEIKTEKPEKEKRKDIFCQILKAPQITEKATDLIKQNQYVFKVYPKANKSEIKKAVENFYGVNVVSVRIVKIPRKQRRIGRISGWKKGYKKAIVKIKGGQKIEMLPR